MIKQILFVIILISLLIFTKFKTNNETYNEIIHLNSDFYIPNTDSIIDLKSKTINSHRICIYEESSTSPTTSSTKNNGFDIECIDAETLITTLNLPNIRHTHVCIDNVCLNENDIKVLNGESSFKIKSKNTMDILDYDKCLGNSNVNTHTCGESINYNINTLKPQTCNNSSSINFKLEHGNNTDGDGDLRHYNYIRKKSAFWKSWEESPNHHNP